MEIERKRKTYPLHVRLFEGDEHMTKTILITGSTDGIGLETAKALAALKHNVLIHGRSEAKLSEAQRQVAEHADGGQVETYRADLSTTQDVLALAGEVKASHNRLDAIINNAGVFNVPEPRASNGLDVRFMVNTIGPYLLTRELMPLLDKHSRVINLSSAAQAPVDHAALTGATQLDAGTAYAQSKLGLTMWTNHLALQLGDLGPTVLSVNPGSFLGTKMVKEAYGSDGKDIGIGVDILTRAALSEEFAMAAGRYYDNDAGRFANPHPDALNPEKNAALAELIEATIDIISA